MTHKSICKVCDRCAMTIPAAAQVCPYCRKDFRTWTGVVKFLIGLVVAYAVLVVIGYWTGVIW